MEVAEGEGVRVGLLEGVEAVHEVAIKVIISITADTNKIALFITNLHTSTIHNSTFLD
jgi:hypothetical protein